MKIVNVLQTAIVVRAKRNKSPKMPIRKVTVGWAFGGAVYKTLVAARGGVYVSWHWWAAFAAVALLVTFG